MKTKNIEPLATSLTKIIPIAGWNDDTEVETHGNMRHFPGLQLPPVMYAWYIIATLLVSMFLLVPGRLSQTTIVACQLGRKTAKRGAFVTDKSP